MKLGFITKRALRERIALLEAEVDLLHERHAEQSRAYARLKQQLNDQREAASFAQAVKELRNQVPAG